MLIQQESNMEAKFVVYTVDVPTKKVVLTINEYYDRETEGFSKKEVVVKLNTDDFTEALNKVNEVKDIDNDYQFHNNLDKNSDWDSPEQDAARIAGKVETDAKIAVILEQRSKGKNESKK